MNTIWEALRETGESFCFVDSIIRLEPARILGSEFSMTDLKP
jgi:hypothetical protein